ncbi:MAG: MBL fold metallo-hydrolase [Kiritimatiellae bacterium]|jgi:L-ascorbate 6-phosphate lactonase|nr:MBL fold metallo-hydrolase [Kiritimatiellia bacterium]
MKLTWLGQSGFLLQSDKSMIACDLYLSDYCQEKSRLDHTRQMNIPVNPDQLDNIDHYLITHGHIDHFDPKTIGPIMMANEKTRFYCPPDCEKLVDEHFAEFKEKFVFIHGFESYKIADFQLIPLPAAHEELEKDNDGEYIAYSYMLLFEQEKLAIFFGGDTIPYDDQVENVDKNVPDGYELILVMPVNGRDKERAELGFKGNLTIEEDIEFYKQLEADLIIPCHFGMFALNDINDINELSLLEEAGCKCIVPRINREIEL